MPEELIRRIDVLIYLLKYGVSMDLAISLMMAP
jgi:hypothetical protein